MAAKTSRVDARRVREVKEGSPSAGPVVYWMSRDQRAKDNWALLYAQDVAQQMKQPVVVIFCLAPHFLGATIRQYGFMLEGLREVSAELHKKNIPFFLLSGEASQEVPEFVSAHGAGAVVADFNPLRVHRKWVEAIAERIEVPFHQVDTHNIVPCWEASDKQEFAAHTIRKKINDRLPEFLTDFPNLRKQSAAWPGEVPAPDWTAVRESLSVDPAVPEVDWIKPGSAAATKTLETFFDTRFHEFDEHRNDPTRAVQTDLSPYLHFGQIAPQRVAWEARHHDEEIKAQEALLEQLVVRRELADNFCWYNEKYDSFDGFPGWAQTTLNEHRSDPRPHLYSRDQLERGATHDELWNAAQQEMVALGKMHGYMRMYWAKKILEWSASPEDALATAIYLNDRYELDGRDPNGYVGIAWSIGGVHDRPFVPRDVFGKIRFMSYNGCKRKFDIAKYVEQTQQLKLEQPS